MKDLRDLLKTTKHICYLLLSFLVFGCNAEDIGSLENGGNLKSVQGFSGSAELGETYVAQVNADLTQTDAKYEIEAADLDLLNSEGLLSPEEQVELAKLKGSPPQE